MIFRKAAQQDLPAVAEIYSDIHTAEEQGLTMIGWVRSIYPTEETARASLERGDLFVAELEETVQGDLAFGGEQMDGHKKRIVGAAIINQTQVYVYEGAPWKYQVPEEQVMVLHTLVISPSESGKGYGKAFIRFYEEYARANECPYLRMDTIAVNSRARAIYRKLGYTEIDIVPCILNGIEGVPLVLLEKKLNREAENE